MKGSPRENSPICSCSSCKSTRAPLKRSDGEGIDKLNLGKNIPLKERILLTKLTRARADYDDLRTKLLSGSSGTEKADLRARKYVKHPDGTDSSSTLLDIVDLVDRGATLNSLSECCSCCVCSSTGVEQKRHKHGHRRHTETISEGGEEVKLKNKRKSEIESKAKSEPSTKLTEPKKTGEPKSKHKENAVLKKALDTTTSKIKSISCTCTLKFSGLIKESKEAVKKLRKEKNPKKEKEDIGGSWFDEYETGEIIRRPKELSRKSYERIEETKMNVKKHLKAGADKSLKKLKETKSKIKAKAKISLEKIKILESKAKIKDITGKSIEKFKESKTKLKAKIKESLEIVKPQTKAPPKPTKPKHEEEVKLSSPRSVSPNSETESEIAFPVENDSLKEFMKKHKNIKDWACGPECIPIKCRPNKCLEILIRKKGHKTKQTHIKNPKIHRKKITSSSASSQAGGISTTKVGPKTKVTPQKKNKKEGHKKPQINLSMKGKSKGLERKILSKTKSATTATSSISVKKGTTWRKGKRKKETSPETKRSVKSVTDVISVKSVNSFTAVKSNVSCICSTPERKTSTKSMTVISKPSANLFEPASLAKKPEIMHRTRKIKAEHKKRFVSRSTTPTYSTVRIIQKPRAHRSSKHKTKKVKAIHVATKQKQSIKSLTAVKSNVSCTCANPEEKKSPKSTTVISRPSAKLFQPISSANNPDVRHRTRKIKAEHKKKPVSRSTTPTSPTVSITQMPSAHRSPKHKTKKIEATHAARSTSSQSTAVVPVKLHTSKKPAPHKPKKVNNIVTSQSRTAMPRPRPIATRPKMNSTFSFDNEFYKTKSGVQYERIEPKKEIRDTGTRKKKQNKHRYSQQIGTKSRQITTINSLRRCFCTLKLSKPNKIKGPKAKYVSKGSETSDQSIETLPSQREMHVSRTVAMKKSEKDRYRQRKLLPYECEPGVCVPNSCYPSECIKLINKMEGPHLKRRTSRSATSNHQTRSSSSFKSRKVHHKTKRVQSTVFSYKSEVPEKYHQTVTTITKPPRVPRTSPSPTSRQAVRIGSSFSFSIEFYKNRPTGARDVPVKQVHRREITRKEVRERAYRPESPKSPKTKHPKKVKAKASESSSHMNAKHQQKSSKKAKASRSSSLMNAKHQQKSILMKTQQTGNIGSAIVRCFCNLKWRTAKPKKKAAQTTAKEELKVATVGTETKRNKYKLKPYECEPYVCIPGECDPYECLERIKKRMHSGTSPERIRTRSVSSTFYSSASSAAIGTSRPRVKRQDTSTKRKKIRNVSESISPTLVSRPTATAPKQIHLIKRPVAAPARQVVRMGSTFSFDIEFYKNRLSVEERVIVNPSSERQIQDSLRRMKERKKEHKAKQTDSNRRNMKFPAKVVSQSNQESQAATTEKRNKNIGVKPLLKRCFCTLQLQKELRKKQKPTAKIYTVSRVTVGETRLTAQRRLMSYQSKHSTLGHEYELYRSREITIGNKRYLHPDSSACTKPSSSEYYMAPKQIQSSQLYHEGQLSNERSFQLKPWDSYSTSETSEETEFHSFTSFVTYSKSNTEPQSGKQNQTSKCMESSEQKTSLSFSRSLVSSISPVIRRWFCTMHPDTSNKHYKAYKLSSESRNGIFSPNKCDLGHCKLIMNGSTATRSKSLCANKKGSLIKAKNRQSRSNLSMDLQTEPPSSFPQVIKSVPIHSEKQAVYAVSNFSFNMEYQKAKQLLSQVPCPPRMVQPVFDSKSINVNQMPYKRTAVSNVATDHSNSKTTEKFEAKTCPKIEPKLKRCPCIMKLKNKRRKKGSNTQNTTTNFKNNKHEIKPQTLGVRPNTKPLRTIQIYRLDRNCTPDSCKPNECLHQNRELTEINSKERQIQHQATSRKHRANVNDNVIKKTHTRSVSPTKIAYKIGSTYSFDLEFYKDSSDHSAPTGIKEVTPAPKVSRYKSKVDAPKKRSHSTKSHDTKSTTITIGDRKALQICKSQIHTKKQDHKIGPSKLTRCFCTLDLQKKGKHPVHASPLKIEKPAKNRYTKTEPYRPIATTHSRSVVAKEKNRKRPKLLPYECEPGVPSSCNTIKCLECINKINFKEMGTNAMRSRSESTKTSNTTRTRARQVQRYYHERPKAAHSTATTKAPKQQIVYRERVMKVPTHKVIESSHFSSDRQAIRIGSNFSFNIEFFKDRGGGGGSHEINTKEGKEREVKSRPSRVKPPKARHVKSRRPKNIRSMQSQAVAKHVRNKMIEVKPFLRRCFCILKLQNRKKEESGKSTKTKPVKKTVKNVGCSAVSITPQNKKIQNRKEQRHKTKIHKHEKAINVGTAKYKKPHKDKKQYQKGQTHKTKIHKNENKALALTFTTANLKVIMPPKAGVSTVCGSSTKNTRRKQKARLLTRYECEPGVCKPGQCNPYECLKRIENREMKTTKSGTHHHRERTTSSHTTQTAKQKGGQTTGKHHKFHRQSQMITRKPQPQVTPEKHIVEESRFKSTSSSLRQAVRISSTLSFNVELYKETSSSYKSVKPAKPILVTNIKKEPNRKKSRASHAHKKQIRHHGAQHRTKTDNKGAGIRPLLQRCFCTLALKKGAHEQRATKHIPKTVESKTVATKTKKERKPKVKEHKAKSNTATVGVGTKKKLYVLKPYECESFVCVPGQCDPYECDKRIRKRIMKDCGTGDRPCKNQCAVTYTPKDGTFRCIDTQCDMKRKHGAKTTATIATRPPKLHPVPQYRKPTKQNVIRIPKNSQRQSVKIGSSFGFDIEFFKDRMAGSIAKEKVNIPKEKNLPRPVKVKEAATRKLPKNSTGTGKYNHCRDQKHGAGIAINHIGTGICPLKRCFCTFKLQKALAPPLNVMRVEVQQKAATQTKPMRDNKQKPRKLAPYECEPGYCIPGECDPWKCLERMRRKLYKEQGTGTHICHRFTKCIAAKCIQTCRNQNTQCNLKHGKKYTQKTECVPTRRPEKMPRQGIVEIPRFPKFGRGVKIGSNISCCIEFYKETIPPPCGTRYAPRPEKIHRVQEPKQYNKPPKQPKMVQECPALKHAKTESKRRSKDLDKQAECTKKAHKGIEAGKMIKKCFCTLKLQDTAACKKLYTVGRVAVLEDRNPSLVCKETKNEVKNSIGSKFNTHENFLFPPRLDCNCYDCVKFKENQVMCNITHNAIKTDSMKIIFPYHPHKFNKNVSNTWINNNNMRHQFPDDFYFSRGNCDRKKKHDTLALKDSRNKEKKEKKTKKHKQPVIKESEKTVSTKFKEFIRRCMGLIKKSTAEKIVPNKLQKLPELIKPTERKIKNKRSKQEKKSDSNVLKTSKSDRHPTNAKIMCVPKTSKSVKVTKVSERDNQNSIFQEKCENYSRFQSGDTAKTQIIKNIQNKMKISQDQKKHVKNRLEETIQTLIAPSSTELNKNNNVMCYNDHKNNFMKNRPPFMDHKVVQMAAMKKCVKNCDPKLCISTMNNPCSGKPVKVYKDQVHVKGFKNYKQPKHVSKNPNYSNVMNSQRICCSVDKPEQIPLVEPNIDQCKNKMTGTKPDPKPKAKDPNDEMDTCKTKNPCACCNNGRRKICSLFRKNEIKDRDKKHVEFTLSKNEHGKCVVECKVASPKDVCKIKKALNKSSKKKLVCDRKPLLEMRLGSDNLRILNKADVYDEIKKINTMKLGRETGAHYKNIESYGDLTTEQLIHIHGKSCSCCICMNRKKTDGSLRLLKGQKPCICGSKPCAKLSLRIATEAMARMKAERERKVCPCGMDICNRETLKQDVKNKIISKKKALKLKKMGMNGKELREQKKKKEAFLKRQKRYKIEDDERRERQRKEDNYLEQQVRKYQDTNDVLLVAESTLDFSKLAVTTVARTIRCMFRSIINYKNTAQSMKNAKDDPARILTNIKGAYEDSGTRSTFRRIRKRLASTRLVQLFQRGMENVPIINFAVHAFDMDPKKRLAKKKRRARRREPIEFECSLFMASLRRRPYLAIYYICPWFYPHCVSMIGILKQFADVMLFILAVLVWSPCILAMEICRTLMCCTLCTG